MPTEGLTITRREEACVHPTSFKAQGTGFSVKGGRRTAEALRSVVPPPGNPETFTADLYRAMGYLKLKDPWTWVEITCPHTGDGRLSR